VTRRRNRKGAKGAKDMRKRGSFGVDARVGNTIIALEEAEAIET
jgi:hypothetical protein